jgi:hypothetical protein
MKLKDLLAESERRDTPSFFLGAMSVSIAGLYLLPPFELVAVAPSTALRFAFVDALAFVMEPGPGGFSGATLAMAAHANAL